MLTALLTCVCAATALLIAAVVIGWLLVRYTIVPAAHRALRWWRHRRHGDCPCALDPPLEVTGTGAADDPFTLGPGGP